jgi:hypothetical protein
LDFLELPTARSGHDFLQVHIDLLTGRVRLVPTRKSATAEIAARKFVGSVFRYAGLPHVLVALGRLGSSLIFGSPHHHNTSYTVTPPARSSG